MERQKTKWRFTNIALLGVPLVLGGVLVPSSRADLVFVPESQDPSPGLSLPARSFPAASAQANVPAIKGTLLDFRLPDEARFWEVHGVQMSAELKRGIHRLSQHLVGTQREKASVYKYCEARKDTAAKQENQLLTPDGVACLYWRWQALAKERRQSEARAQNISASARSGHKKASKKQKRAAPSVVHFKTVKDLQAIAHLPYDVLLKKIEFKSEAGALNAAQVAGENGKDCGLTSVRAAVLRDLENYLPSDAVWKAINRLYDVTAPCLAPAHEAFEVVNGRLALMHLDRNQLVRAASLLEVTLQGKNLEDEEIYLFWRGFVDTLQGPLNGSSGKAQEGFKLRSPYWQTLIDKYPLTLHALVADHMSGNDAYERYARRPQPEVSAYSGQTWNFENVSHLMAGIFWVSGKKAELERISRLLDEQVGFASFETAMFRLKFFEAAAQQRSIIKTISQSIKQFGSQHLSLELLKPLYPVQFRNEIARQAAYIDPALIFSLIRQESSFNPKATSPVGARGLMQVMPTTARRVERNRNLDLYDPNTNIRIGAKYLHILWKKHNGDYSRLIASYNAGPNNTKKWESRYNGKIPMLFADLVPFPETRHYVSGLMRHMYWYRELVSHVKETSGEVKIKWSWSLTDVVPRPEQFGLAQNQVLQIKYEPLPWLPEQGRTSAADARN